MVPVGHVLSTLSSMFEAYPVSQPEDILTLCKADWTKYEEITVAGTAIHFFRRPKRFGGLNQI